MAKKPIYMESTEIPMDRTAAEITSCLVRHRDEAVRGTIDPGPRREVQVLHWIFALENSAPVAWTCDANGNLVLRSYATVFVVHDVNVPTLERIKA